MKVLTEEHAARLLGVTLAERVAQREHLLSEIQATLHRWAEMGLPLEPFEHGTLWNQIAHEALDVRAAYGDEIASERCRRRNQKLNPATRTRVYKRDDHTCQMCGWRPPDQNEERAKAYRGGRFLTIDHILPLAEGGSNSQRNLQTLCNVCNQKKGKQLVTL